MSLRAQDKYTISVERNTGNGWEKVTEIKTSVWRKPSLWQRIMNLLKIKI
jgi:hypothetical protein